MALSELDRDLLQQCLGRMPQAWERFVDRYLGLVVHVINHTTQSRAIKVGAQDREDLAAEVFLAFVADDFGVLRRFREQSSLATYLTVVARRVVVRELLRRKSFARLTDEAEESGRTPYANDEERMAERDEVERLLEELAGLEADVVRLYHLEGKSYEEIAAATGMPANSVGPTLTRARAKLRRAANSTVRQ